MRVAKKDVARLKNFLTYSAHILNGAAKQAQAIANVVSRKVRARIVSWAKRHTLPGFDKLPLYAVWLVFQQHSERNMLNIRSRAIAFSFMLAIFPSIIFLFSLLPYIPIKNFDTTMFKFLNEVLPHNAYDLLYSTIFDLMTIPRGGVLSLGFFLTIFFSSNGVFILLQAFDRADRQLFKKRTPLQLRITSLKLLFILFGLLLVSIFLVIAGSAITTFILRIFNARTWSYITAFTVRWAAILFLYYSAIVAIYRQGSAIHKLRGYYSVGALLATIISIAISLGFSYFVNNFGSFNQVYGSIGTLIVAMIWLNLNSLALLIGYELNVSVFIAQQNRDKNKALSTTTSDTTTTP
jgi:membrane protein